MNEIEEIKARLDLVDVVSSYVPLQKSGRTFKANCPFHSEKTPSFIVNPDRQSWHCFGACGTGGDVISFVMKREGMDFPEALRLLADRAGVRLPERQVSEAQERERQKLYSANEAAAEWFSVSMAAKPGAPARSYLERRGIDDGTASAFRLGFSPPLWEGLRTHLTGLGFTDRDLLDAGLLTQGDSSPHDRFRNRLMFPVSDIKGRIIGFGARALDDSLPKYLNTAQTALFDKSGTLYALDRAQEAIRGEGRAVIVEGYMDVIAAHQFGFANVVAQMGTALTERQVRILRRLTTNVVLALDADAAGTAAAVRGHDVVRGSGARPDEGDLGLTQVNWRALVSQQERSTVNLLVAVLPPGMDPDDVVRESPETWRRTIEQAQPVLDFRLDTAAASRDLADPRQRSELVSEFGPLLSALTDPVVRAHYIQRLSRLAQIGEAELAATLSRRGERAGTGPSTAQRVSGATLPGSAKEDFLLALLLRYPSLQESGAKMDVNLLWQGEARQLFEIWSKIPEPAALADVLPAELLPYFERLVQWNLPFQDRPEAEAALVQCKQDLERRKLLAEKQVVASQIADLQEREGLAGTEDQTELDLLIRRDMEIARELHLRERSGGERAVEVTVDG